MILIDIQKVVVCILVTLPWFSLIYNRLLYVSWWSSYLMKMQKKQERVYLNLMVQVNIELCSWLVLKLFGFNCFSLNWVFLEQLLYFCLLTTSVIQIAANPVLCKRIKHIEVECHYIWDACSDHIISLNRVLNYKYFYKIIGEDMTSIIYWQINAYWFSTSINLRENVKSNQMERFQQSVSLGIISANL